MNFFPDSLSRLKHLLRVSKDGEVAEALGLSKTAFAERKRRGSFPDRELFSLALRRPELGIDVNYVLRGETAKQQAENMQAKFPARLREVRAKRSPAAFAKLLDVPVDELKQLESGARPPTKEFFDRLVATHSQHSPAWLAGGDVPTLLDPPSQLEVVLIRNYRASSPEGQAALRHQAAFLAEQNKPTEQKT